MNSKVPKYVVILAIVLIFFGILALTTKYINDTQEEDVQKEVQNMQPTPQNTEEIKHNYAEAVVQAIEHIEDNNIVEYATEVPEEESTEQATEISEEIPEEEEEQKPATTEPINDTKLYIWQKLREAGFSEEATAGIMGNIQAEHGFSTTDTSNGLGLCQWLKGRRSACIAWCNNMGVSYTSLEGQTSYLVNEVQTSEKPIGTNVLNYKSAISIGYSKMGETAPEIHIYNTLDEFKETTDVDQAALAVMGNFERCAKDAKARVEVRVPAARTIYATYKGM